MKGPLPRIGRSATIVIAASDASQRSKRDADFVCGGADDDRIIQAAIETLPASGGRIQLSEGTFRLSGQIRINRHNVTVGGRGWSTKLLPTAFSSHLMYVGEGGDNCVLESFSLDGCRTEFPDVQHFALLVSRASNCRMSHLKIHDTPGSAIYALNADFVTVEHCWTRDNGQSGITLSADGTDLTGARVLYNTSTNNGLNGRIPNGDLMGVQIEGSVANGTHVVDVLVHGNILDGNEGSGLFVLSAKRITATSNVVSRNRGEGIVILASTDVTFDGIECHDNSRVVAPGYETGLRVSDGGGTADGCERIRIVNSRFSGHNGRSVRVWGDASFVHIDGNDLLDDLPLAVDSTGHGFRIGVNNGFTSTTSGGATLGSGETSIVVRHNLSNHYGGAPPIENVRVVPTSDLNGASWWISTPTEHTFTLHLDRPVEKGASFAWEARCRYAS